MSRSGIEATNDGWHQRRAATRLTLFIAYVVASLFALPATSVLAADTTVLITGSNKGLGLEFARQYAARGWQVIATCRRPDEATDLQALAAENPNVTIERLDVTDHPAIDALAEKYKDTPIDILVNNAGINGDPSKTQNFGKFDYDAFRYVLEVNTIGPIKMAEAFVEHVKKSELKKILTVSSSVGSIAQTRGGLYFYRTSKTAVNMMMRNLALQLKGQGIIVGMLNPGPTDTDLMKEVKMPLRDPKDAVADMIRNMDNMTIETTGSFIQYDGTEIPW